VLLGLADEEGHPRVGIVSSVDNRLDPASGTIRVRAVFDNADGMLLPGLYARVRLGGAEHGGLASVDVLFEHRRLRLPPVDAPNGVTKGIVYQRNAGATKGSVSSVA
jgi:multidrug efflux pump subunit AcrA (membrane-fusion protein)